MGGSGEWPFSVFLSVIWFLIPDPCFLTLAGPGGVLLFRALRRSTIGAEGFHGRVRDGIGCLAPRHDHQAEQGPGIRDQQSGIRDQLPVGTDET